MLTTKDVCFDSSLSSTIYIKDFIVYLSKVAKWIVINISTIHWDMIQKVKKENIKETINFVNSFLQNT
jgi:hypothetical protein